MKKTHFDRLASAVTLLAGIIGAIALYFLADGMRDSDSTRHWWMGLFFLVIFLLGFGGLHIYLQYSKYQVQRPKLWIVWALVAAVAVFGIGAGAEYIYMRSTSTDTSTTTVKSGKAVDIVLLLDSSGSMDSVKDVRNTAMEAFINSLSENCQLQVMSFAAGLNELDSSELVKMDASGKAAAIDFMKNIDIVGQTNFDFAAEKALTSLTSDPNARKDAKKAVIMVTDAAGDFLGTSSQGYLDNSIQFFTIRLNTFDLDPPQELMDFVTKTGGFDQSFLVDENGKIDSDDILKAFQDAFASTSESKTDTVTKKEFTDNLLICTDSVNFFLMLLRTVALTAVAVLFGIGYFGTVDPRSAAISCVVGLAVSVVAMLNSLLICTILSAILLGTAIVALQVEEGVDLDV